MSLLFWESVTDAELVGHWKEQELPSLGQQYRAVEVVCREALGDDNGWNPASGDLTDQLQSGGY